MIKRCNIALVAILIIITTTLTSCDNHIGTYWIAIGMSLAMPLGHSPDLKGKKIEVMETDQQGRELVMCKYKFIYTGEDGIAVIIFQHHDEKYIYFYEDQCFIMDDCSDDNIQNLKERNDWNKELNLKKATKRQMKMVMGELIYDPEPENWSKVEIILKRELGSTVWKNQYDCFYLEGNQKEKYTCGVITSNGEYYCVLMQNYKAISHIKFTDKEHIAEEYASFKAENGWFDE